MGQDSTHTHNLSLLKRDRMDLDTNADLDTEPRPTWLERLRAIPRGVWGFMVLLLALLTPLLVRTWFLSQVPDIGDPFDVAAFCKSMEVPLEEDALPIYRSASQLFASEQAARGGSEPARERIDPVLKQGWSVADDSVKEWLAVHEPSLREWKRAAEMDQVRFDPSENLNSKYANGLMRLRFTFSHAVQLKGRQCEGQSEFMEAFEWYRALLRSRRQSAVSLHLYELDLHDLVRWASLPQVSADQLKTALELLRRDHAALKPTSDEIKREYIRAMNSLRDRDGLALATRYRSGHQSDMHEREALVWRSLYWVVGEPERTRRIYQHVTANYLREIDKPATSRQGLFRSTTLLYSDNPTGSLPPGHFPAGQISRAIKSSAISHNLESHGKGSVFLLHNGAEGMFLHEARAYPVLLELTLALQAHHRVHGAFPAALDELVPTYFDSVPIDPCDPNSLSVRYKNDGLGQATLWSVGSNGTDENGFRSFVSGDVGLDVRAPAVVSNGSVPETGKD